MAEDVLTKYETRFILFKCMANLFFVHTPMQLFVAQQLIHHESLVNNIMLYGYNGSRTSFLDTYKLMEIQGMWKYKYFLEGINMWADIGFGDIRSFRRTFKNIRYIKKIINKHHITAIFLGDIDNYSHIFGALYFSRFVKVFMYEEGSSHYTYKYHVPDKRLFQNLSSIVLDCLIYVPFFHFSFRRYRRHLNSLNMRLPISGRYNIIPSANIELYDKDLVITELYSDSINKILESQIRQMADTKHKLLLITNDVYQGDNYLKRYDIYLNTIKGKIKDIPKNSLLLLKMHPNENEDKVNDIIAILEQNGLCYFQLSKDINIPVEYYLQRLKFEEIIHFMSSSIFYNGYIYPYCKTTNLFKPFYERCVKECINMDDVFGLYKQCDNY